jgi:hypothetical protein
MHSLYEIETTVKRVARHQGLSWGIAEEAGKIVRSLEQSELPGLESFNRLISFPYNKCETVIDLTKNNHKNLCPIHFSIFFLDQSHATDLHQSFKFLNMQEPLLAIPLLIKAAQKNLISFEFTSTELKFFISSGNIMILDKNQIPHQSNNITMKISNKRQPQYSEETWDRLYELSLETFVEESEEKKLSGAGAGLTDND